MSAESGFWNTIWSARTSSACARWKRGASGCPSSSTEPRRRRDDARGACGRASSCRCPTRRRGRASPPARSPPRRRRARGCRVRAGGRSCRDRRTGASGGAARSTAGSATSAASSAAGRCACSWKWQRLACPSPTSYGGGASSRQIVLGEHAAVGEDAARGQLAEVRQEARNRVEPTVVLADAAARDAAQEADGVRVTRVVEHRRRRGLPPTSLPA